MFKEVVTIPRQREGRSIFVLPPLNFKWRTYVRLLSLMMGLGSVLGSTSSLAEIYCAAVSGLAHDKTGAFQKIYDNFIGPQVPGHAISLPEGVVLPPGATGALRLGQYYCPVFPSWALLKDYYFNLAQQEAVARQEDLGDVVPPPSLLLAKDDFAFPSFGAAEKLPQLLIMHLAHGMAGGGICADDAENGIAGQEIMEHLYQLATYYQVALANDACYGSDLQLAKLRYEIAMFQRNYPVHERQTYKVGRVCLISSAPLGQVTKGTPLLRSLCTASEQNKTPQTPRPCLDLPTEFDWVNASLDAAGPLRQDWAAGRSSLDGTHPAALLAGLNLVQILSNTEPVFWSGLDFDHLGISDVLFYRMAAQTMASFNAAYPEEAEEVDEVFRVPRSMAQDAAQSAAKMYRLLSSRLLALAQSTWWPIHRRELQHYSSRHWMRPILEAQVAPLVYWVLAAQEGRTPESLQDLMFYYHGGYVFKEEALAWLAKFKLQWGEVEQNRAVRVLREIFPSDEFSTTAAMQAAFEKGRGRKIWAYFPTILAEIANQQLALLADAEQGVAVLNTCLALAQDNLKTKLAALPPQTKVAYNFIARTLEESFYQRPGEEPPSATIPANCFGVRTLYGLTFFQTQWREVFYEASDALELALQGHDVLGRIGLAYQALLENDAALAFALAPLVLPAEMPYDVAQIKFWQQMNDHVLGQDFTTGRLDADPVSQGNFEPWGMVLPLISHLKMPNYFWPQQSLPLQGLPGEELDYLRAKACWPFGAAWPLATEK